MLLVMNKEPASGSSAETNQSLKNSLCILSTTVIKTKFFQNPWNKRDIYNFTCLAPCTKRKKNPQAICFSGTLHNLFKRKGEIFCVLEKIPTRKRWLCHHSCQAFPYKTFCRFINPSHYGRDSKRNIMRIDYKS